jgi:hypothetical protein
MGLAGLALFVGRATADVTIDRAGSVVIFPKVIADGERDTLITLSNVSNMPVMAHCAYVMGAGFCQRSGDLCQIDLDCPEIEGQPNPCVIEWQAGDFDIWLTMKQPTMWRVSTGRIFDPTAVFDREKDPEKRAKCRHSFKQNEPLECPGFFFASEEDFESGTGALVNPPPFTGNFRGELKCVEVAPDGSLVLGDHLKGEATILTLGSSQISRYNSINIQGAPGTSDSPTIARLNGSDYNACPEAVEMTHFASDGNNFIAEGIGADCEETGCPVRTELTFIPCTQDLVGSITGEPERTGVGLEIFDEFETRATSSLILECWANLELSQIAEGFGFDGSTLKKTRAATEQDTVCRAGENRGDTCDSDADCGAGGVCGPRTGILTLVEQFFETDETLVEVPTGVPATAAASAYMVNNDSDADIARTGRCRGALGTTCTSDSQCPAGRCRRNSDQGCLVDADCVTTNSQCTANDVPAPCCSGSGTGTCPAPGDIPENGDICDRCMNDEIFLAEPGF